MNKTIKIPNLFRDYSRQSLLLTCHTDLKVPVLNVRGANHNERYLSGCSGCSRLTLVLRMGGSPQQSACVYF